MERGEIRSELNTTQPEQPSVRWLEEVIDTLALNLGIDRNQLAKTGVIIKRIELPSQYNQTVISDNCEILVWFNDNHIASIYETRDEFNRVNSKLVYFGLSHGS